MHAHSLPRPPYRIALAGAGTVGTAVAAALQRRGHAVSAVWSRTPGSARAAAARLDAPVAQSCSVAGVDADLVLVGVSDDAIEAVASELTPGLAPGCVVVHFAGSLGVTPLDAARIAGATVAALHPVQALPDPDTALARLPGCAWGVTCETAARQWAHRLVRDDLEGVPVDVAELDRPVWHAAAVVASNGIAAVMSTGAALLHAIGVADGATALGPLATGTLANVLGTLDGRAFTGPVVRAERRTIERHLVALSSRAPDLVEEYALEAAAIVAGAERTERIDAATAASMRALLGRT